VRKLFCCAVLALLGAASSRAADAVLLNLVMPDARAAAGVDVARSLASPLGQFALAQVDPQAGQQLEQLRELTGFDPRSDLREVLVASAGPQAGRRIVIAAGSFDPARVMTAARDHGAQISSYRGIEILTFGGNGKHVSALAFLSPTLAVTGDTDSVGLAIERYQKPGPPLDPQLATRISSVSAGADAWFVCLIPGTELAQGSGWNANVLAAVQQVAGSLQLGPTVMASAEISAVGPQEAAALADLVRMMASIARLNPKDPKAAALLELLGATEVSAAGSTVRLRLAIPEARLESIIGLLRPR